MDFKPIRNKIRTFSYNSLVQHILHILRQQEKKGKPAAIWHPLILLKWSLEFSEYKYPPKEATKKDVINLLNKLDSLELSHSTFNLKKNSRVSKTFTILAYQQFMYQEYAWWDSFSRQLILFNQLHHKYDIALSFKNKVGIKIDDFLKILYIIWLSIFHIDIIKVSYHGFISNDILEIIKRKYGVEVLQNLVSLFTVNKENISEILSKDSRQIRNYNLQSFEPSIFTRKPFFNFNNKYFIPHKDVLNHTINYFIYEFMKNRDKSFSRELGMRMEKYIQLGLTELELNFITEKELKTKLSANSNLVDFVVEGNILIESKAIEMNPYPSINPEDEILANEFRKDLVKAYSQQMVNVANELGQYNEYYGIIVTYKKIYLGDSSDMWDQFLKSETLKNQDEDSLKILPIENLFLIDLYSWDLLMQLLKERDITLIEVLKKARLDDSDPKTKKFTFAMHLEEYGIKNFTLNYLEAANEEIKACV